MSSSTATTSTTKPSPEDMQLLHRLAEKKRQLMQVSTQLQFKTKDMKYKEIQLRELESSHCKSAYVAVGKMFLASSPKEISSDIQRKLTSLTEDISALSKKQSFLEKSCQEEQAQLRSLMVKKS